MISLFRLAFFSNCNYRNMNCEDCIFLNELFIEILFIIWAVKFYKLSFWGGNTFLCRWKVMPYWCNSNVTPVNSALQIVTSCPFMAHIVWYLPGLLALLRLSHHDKQVEILDITLARWPVHDSHANTYNVWVFWLYFILFFFCLALCTL